MNKLNILVPLIALFFSVSDSFYLNAQTDKELLAELVAEDQDAINALVLYPKETRISILEASLHPEALIKLESIQSQTSSAFLELIENYPKETQELIWDMTRYPNLVKRLAIANPNSKNEVKDVLNDYPEVIHRRARIAAYEHHSLLMEIDALNYSAEKAFNFLINEYPVRTQNALRELIELPEVLTILTDNIRLTVLAGDVYRKNPEWVLHKADSFHLEVARRNAEELEDWKAGLENNPDALNELRASAETYEEEYGYDNEYYEYDYDDLYYDGEVNVVVRHYYHYNYPYWFGYPTWYYYPRWRLYPVWYDWGFYVHPSGSCMVMNLPSFHFMHWYFYQPHHHYYWPHLSAHFTRHYRGHRPSGNNSSITVTVNEWQRSNREVVNDDWMRNDGRLEDRFEEYGKFESARVKYNQEHPAKEMTKREYLEKNTRRYPNMNEKSEGIKKENRTYIDPKNRDGTEREKVSVPRKKNEPIIKEKTAPEKREIEINKRDRVEREKVTVPKKKNETVPWPQTEPGKTTPKINTGNEYHKNTWEKSKNNRPQSAPKPKVPSELKAPSKTTPKASRTTVPKRKKN